MNGRLLVFNCHEAWVHQLRLLGRPLDIIVDLSGRHTRGWDEAMRPVPPSSRLITLPDVLVAQESYDCIIAHNLTDLLDVKSLPGPRLLVLHITLESLVLEQHAQTPADEFRRTAAGYLDRIRAHVMAVTILKGRSWGFSENIVHSCADPADYLPWQGDLPRGLRVANFVSRRQRYLLWNFHRHAFADLPVTLVGHKRTVMERFPPEAFRYGMERAITAAQAKWQEALVSATH